MGTITFLIVAIVVIIVLGYTKGVIAGILGYTWGVSHATVKSARNPNTGYKALKAQAQATHDVIIDNGVVKGTGQVVKQAGDNVYSFFTGKLAQLDTWLESEESDEDEKTVSK